MSFMRKGQGEGGGDKKIFYNYQQLTYISHYLQLKGEEYLMLL